MIPSSVIKVRDALKKENRPFKLFFDNNQIVNSMTDVISWNDELSMIHVIRATQEAPIQRSREIETMSFSYDDIRSISFFTDVADIAESMVKLSTIGATEYNAERGAKITKYFNDLLHEQNKSKY